MTQDHSEQPCQRCSAEHNALREVFNRVWKRLARVGQCDAWGGDEYRRVYAEWVAAGRPVTIAPFIRANANRPPSPKGGA